MVRAIYLDLLL